MTPAVTSERSIFSKIHEYNAPINVSHPPGEVRQSRGFDLIRIQLSHPPGNIRIPIPPSYTGHTRGVTGGLTGHVYVPLRATCIFHAGAHSLTLVQF